MATIDPSIALGVKPLQLENPMNAFAQMSQIQAYQRQNALANRTMEQEDALNRAYASSIGANGQIDENMLRQNVVGANLGSKLPAVEKTLLEGRKLKNEVTKGEFENKQARYNQSINDILRFDNHDQILGALKQKVDSKELTAEQAQQLASTVPQDPRMLPAWQIKTARGLLDAKDRLTTQETERHNRSVEGTAQGQLKVAQENQRREADPEFQQKLAEAKAMGQNMAKDKVLRAAQLPKVLDTAQMTLSEIDDLIGKRDEKGALLPGQKPHRGFQDAVGATYLPGARFVPGSAASDFQSRFDQVKGGAFLQAFETLKGGGSITNVEGDKGTAALNRMGLAQSEKEFVQAAREFQGIVRKGVERASKSAGVSVPSGNASSNAGEIDTSNPLLGGKP